MVRCGGAGTPSRRLSQQLYLLFIADKAHNLWVVQKFKCPRECQETKSQGISLGDGSLTVGQLTSGPVGCAASGRVNYTCVHLSLCLAPPFVLPFAIHAHYHSDSKQCEIFDAFKMGTPSNPAGKYVLDCAGKAYLFAQLN